MIFLCLCKSHPINPVKVFDEDSLLPRELFGVTFIISFVEAKQNYLNKIKIKVLKI